MLKRQGWLVCLLCLVTLVPFLWSSDYNTKGEPREAIVSYSMLENGNWVLPRNNGGEMAYKPPFFHWSVAAVSALLGGEVTEGSSRLPSALALTVLVVSTFVFYARRKDTPTAFVAAGICLLCMELHRAGGNCRVDMVLTACTVGALYLLYRWWQQGLHRLPWAAILLMSLGTLTKGPVGTVIPCMVAGVFLAVKAMTGERGKLTGLAMPYLQLCLSALLSLVLPALWYYAAWRQGGKEFLDLMYEENVGRMTHSMSYESHAEPWWYNFLTLTYGLLPFTLVLLFGLFSLGNWPGRLFRGVKQRLSLRQVQDKTRMDDVTLFSLVAAVVIIAFYCIPQSKRSVYLMPMYPVLAYFIARFMLWLAGNRKKSLSLYTSVLAGLGLLAFIAFIVCKLRLIPESVFSGRHAAESIATIHAIGDISSWWQILLILIPTIICGYWWKYADTTPIGKGHVYFSLLIALTLNLAVDGAYKSPVLNVKSVKHIASDLRAISHQEKARGAGYTLYEYIEQGEKALGDPVHYFELNFYLSNTIENFMKSKPQEGILLIGDEDFALRQADFGKDGYVFDGPVYMSDKKIVGEILNVYRFHK